MKTKVITTITVTLFLVSTLSMAFNISRVAAPSVEGELYAGGSDPGVVYRYVGGTEWEVISPALGYSVLSLVEYEGTLYAGTMSYSSNYGVGRVYRYDGIVAGEHVWTLVGDDLDNAVHILEVYNNDLYAGTSWHGARLYRYEDPGWTRVVDYGGWSGIRSAYVWEKDNWLYLGDIGWDKIGRYDGNVFQYLVHLGGSCMWDFESYDDILYGSAYYGRIHMSSDGTTWTTLLDYIDRNVWEMQTFQGYLYYGTDWMYSDPQEAQLWRYDGVDREHVWSTPVNHHYEGIISMCTDGTQLFIGMGGEPTYYGGQSGTGKVYSYDGTTATLISVPGNMGIGVQVLYCVPAMRTIAKTLNTSEGDLGDIVHATLRVIVPSGETAAVVDTLPSEWSYINGTFAVNGVPATPTVTKNRPPPPIITEVSYTITEPGIYWIGFDCKVDMAYWEDREVCNVATATWYSEEPIPGDCDGDGDVDDDDVAIVEAAYGSICGDPGYDPRADLNDDCIVDLADRAIVLFNYGTTNVVETKEDVECFIIHAFEELNKNLGLPAPEKVKVIPAPVQFWREFIGGVTDVIVFDPPEITEGVALLRDYVVLELSPGDVDGDGDVDGVDVGIVEQLFGCIEGIDPEYDPRADLNDDGIIDIMDIYLVNYYYYYGTSSRIPLDLLTWEGTEELPWIEIDEDVDGDGIRDPYILGVNEVVEYDIPTGPDASAVLVRYTVAWESTPDVIEAHFVNEAILESESPQVIVGQLSNFDVHNDYHEPVDNFELELYGIQPSDIVDWFPGWGTPPQINPIPPSPEMPMGGTEIMWQDHTQPIQPCEWEHFGLHLKPGVIAVGAKAYWTQLVMAELTIKEKTEVQWAMTIEVTNPYGYTMKNVTIKDNFGAELEIDEVITAPDTNHDGIVDITDLSKVAFNFGIMALLDQDRWDPVADINSDGIVDIVDISTVSMSYGLTLWLTGKTDKVHLFWYIGDLPPGETASITILVSTDLNPAGHQEYTEPGVYEMNSGATLKFIDPLQNTQLSAVTDSIYVTVLPLEDP